MHQYSRLCLFGFLTAISLSISGSVIGSDSQEGKPQLQIQVEQFTPDINGETKFIQESEDRFDKLKQENQGMIKADKQMMQDSYDPNEKYFQPHPKL